MNPDQIKALVNNGSLSAVEGVDPASAVLLSDQLHVDGLVPLPIVRVAPWVNRTEDLGVKDENGRIFGTLCFTRGITEENVQILTKWRFVAYLADMDVSTLAVPVISRDYLVVDSDFLNEYQSSYKSGAPIWGSFSHEEYDPPTWTDTTQPIVASRDLGPPTQHHQELFQRYLVASNSFERFLRLYHSVELLFDYIIYRKIRNLNNDLSGYATIMKENAKSELDRIKIILNAYCSDYSEIIICMLKADDFKATCEAIFQEHSKDGNPLAERWDKFWPMITDGSLTLPEMKKAGFGDTPQASKTLLNIVSYWIYRVRCSIAHNRVGEFILRDEHDQFVSEFASPLLLSVLKQLFGNPDFIGLQV